MLSARHTLGAVSSYRAQLAACVGLIGVYMRSDGRSSLGPVVYFECRQPLTRQIEARNEGGVWGSAGLVWGKCGEAWGSVGKVGFCEPRGGFNCDTAPHSLVGKLSRTAPPLLRIEASNPCNS